MRWDESHESEDLIDRRGDGPARSEGGLGMLFYLLPWLLQSRIGRVILVVGGLFFVGRTLFSAVHGPVGQGLHGGETTVSGPAETPEVHFIAFVLDDVQESWQKRFTQAGEPQAYRHAKLVLYTDSTDTGCGYGSAATGPFYCPADERVYLDLGFFRELSGRLGARGQFAQAYVVAHEIGHHVQKLLGISDKVEGLRHTEGATGASVRLELQADCFAGIWARSTQQRDLSEEADIQSAITAAAAVGDDRLQRAATGTVSPESWTHGSSEERVRWFQKGLTATGIPSCDTFSAKQL
jgi:predicted metalloprotease